MASAGRVRVHDFLTLRQWEKWSGRAVTGGRPYTYVHSTFVQPSVTCSGVADQHTSNWVGLAGFNDETVEQDGTFAWRGGADHTTPKYEALQLASPSPSLNAAADTSLWSCSRHRPGSQLLGPAQESQRDESSHPVSQGCTTNARPSRKRCSVK